MKDEEFKLLIETLKEEKNVQVFIDGENGLPDNSIVIGQCLDELVGIHRELRKKNHILDRLVDGYYYAHNIPDEI